VTPVATTTAKANTKAAKRNLGFHGNYLDDANQQQPKKKKKPAEESSTKKSLSTRNKQTRKSGE
jgi:hypothetical protein